MLVGNGLTETSPVLTVRRLDNNVRGTIGAAAVKHTIVAGRACLPLPACLPVCLPAQFSKSRADYCPPTPLHPPITPSAPAMLQGPPSPTPRFALWTLPTRRGGCQTASRESSWPTVSC